MARFLGNRSTRSAAATGRPAVADTGLWRHAVMTRRTARASRRNRFAMLMLLLTVGIGCQPAADPDEAYRVTVDVGPWMRALGDDDLFQSEPAKERLVALGAAAIEPLALALEQEPAAVRAGAVEVLGEIGLPECVAPLLLAAHDTHAEVRVEALRALAVLGDERARSVVEQALEDPDEAVVLAAAAACERMCRSPGAMRRLVEIAVTEGPASSVARGSLRAMLAAEDPRRAAVVRGAIETVAIPLLEADAAPRRRERAALVAADAGDGRAVPWLAAAADDDGTDRSLRIQTLLALGALGDRSAVGALRRAVERQDPALRAAACAGLERLEGTEVCPPPAGAAAYSKGW